MGILMREYWSGLPCPPLGDIPNPGTEPKSPALQADSLPSGPSGKPKNTRVGRLSLLHGNLPDPGIELRSPVLQVDSLPTELVGWLIKPKVRSTRQPSYHAHRFYGSEISLHSISLLSWLWGWGWHKNCESKSSTDSFTHIWHLGWEDSNVRIANWNC